MAARTTARALEKLMAPDQALRQLVGVVAGPFQGVHTAVPELLLVVDDIQETKGITRTAQGGCRFLGKPMQRLMAAGTRQASGASLQHLVEKKLAPQPPFRIR